MKPRYYQTECVDAFLADAKKYKGEHLLAALPTGTGKSVIIAMLAKEIADRGGRCIILARNRELLVQNNERYNQIDPLGLQRVGVYSAGLGMRQVNEQVTFAGVQSIYKRADELGKINAVIVDEAHQLSFDQDSQYQQLIRGLQQNNPSVRLFGLTATPFRSDGVIHGSVRSLFSRMSYVLPLSDMFDREWLTRPVTLPSDSVDMTGVKITAGEYNRAEAQSKFLGYWSQNQKTAEILATANSKNRKSCIVFCSGVAHAELVFHELTQLGESACIVTGDTLPLIRETHLQQFKEGKKRWIINVDVLTTGFDATRIDYIVSARATQSAGLFSQIIGRGLRLHNGKKECFVTDFGGNVDRFGPIDSPLYGEGFIKEPTGKTGEPPKRVCPKCFEIFAAGKKICPKCGLELPEKEKVMVSTKTEITVKTSVHTVVHEDFKVWKGRETGEVGKDMKPIRKKDTLLVQYKLKVDEGADLGDRKRWTRAFLCPEHTGYARDKFVEWWNKRSTTHAPETIDEAMELIGAGVLAKTLTVSIRPDGKWDRIVAETVAERPSEDSYDLSDVPF
jgi:DNA repair protein RadD